MTGIRPVVGLDIDGTLVDYHSHYLRFASGYFGREFDLNYDARISLPKFMGVSKTRYRESKLAYRRGEMKRSVPLLPEPYPNARQLTLLLRRWGCDVWLCTTRPYLSHDAVDDATRHNLRRNGVLYQGIIWGEHKYRELVRTVGKARVVGVLDDLPEMCLQAVKLGLRTAFAVRPHNGRQLLTYQGVAGYPWELARTADETAALFRNWLDDWKDSQ